MSITLNGTTGITTPDITSAGSLNIDASAPDNSLVVNSAGNVGIGTSSPAVGLDVRGPVGIGMRLRNTASGLELATRIDATTVGLDAGNTSGGMTFSTNTTERARIDSSGNLLVGTTSSIGAARFVVAQNTAVANPMSVVSTEAGAIGRYAILFYRNTNDLVGSIQTTNTATSYNTSSDYRLKEDWQPMTGASERVQALKPVNFAWKVDGSRVDGFLAHEAQEVVPEAVHGTKDAVDAEGNPNYQGIDQSKLVPLLTAALQEALTKINALTARIEALEQA
jgi:hypothetical protein